MIFMSEAEYSGEHKAHWVTISSDEYESMKATLEILSDPELRDEALKGKDEATRGKARKLEDIKKELGL